MRHAPVVLPSLRAPIAAEPVAWLLGVVLLLQLCLAGPLTLRMAPPVAALDAELALCLSAHGDDGAGQDRPTAPPVGHTHDQCLWCQAAVGAILGAPSAQLLPAFQAAVADTPIAPSPVPPRLRPTPYVSRAPPPIA